MIKIIAQRIFWMLERHHIFNLQSRISEKPHYTYCDKPVGVDPINQSG